ncbi:hypothetical protein JXB41_01880 [Candidatus Woesearchaeota archaeon]|nr:hypothetical protein [Candidatus Woesearchaeota archaeon]
MEQTIERIKEFVKQKLDEEDYNKLLESAELKAKNNFTSFENEVVFIGTLFSKFDESILFDYLQRFDIPLNIIQDIFAYMEQTGKEK